MRRHLGLLALTLAVAAVAGLVWLRRIPSPQETLPAANVPDSSPVLSVEQAQFTSAGEFDPGTLRILLRNPNDFPVRLTELTWDGLPLPTFGVDLDWRKMPPRSAGADKALKAGKPPTDAHPDSGQGPPATKEADRDSRRAVVPGQLYRAAYWSRIEPDGTLPPGGVAMVTAKLSSAPTRRINIGVTGLARRDQPKPQPLVSFFVDPAPTSLSVARMAFADEGRRVFVYVQNGGSAPRVVTRVEINGRPCGDGLWLPQKDIPAGGHTVIGFTPTTAFKRGEFVATRVVTDGGGAIAQVRAFWGFPLGVEGGVAPAEWGLDPKTRVWHPGFLSLAHPDLPPADRATHASGGINVMSCVICGFGQLNTVYDTAQEMLRRYEATRVTVPEVPVVVNPCRVEPEKGYALFAPTADALMVNPAVSTSLALKERRSQPPILAAETAFGTVAHLAHAGRAASAPALFYPLLSTGQISSAAHDTGSISPEEFRARLYTLLSEGADGLLYRHKWAAAQTGSAGLNDAIFATNKEVTALMPWLSVGGAQGPAQVEGVANLTALTRSAGDAGLLVFLMRKDAGEKTAEKRNNDNLNHEEGDPASKPIESAVGPLVRLTVPMPTWAKPAGVFEARPEGLVPVPGVTLAGGNATFAVPVPEGGSCYVVNYEMSP